MNEDTRSLLVLLLSKKSMSSIVLIIVVLLAGIFFVRWFFFKPHFKILEIQTFSCFGMPGPTFEYPVFKGWEPSLARKLTAVNNECIIFLSSSNLMAPRVGEEITTPQIKIQKVSPAVSKEVDMLVGWFVKKRVLGEHINPHGIHYLNWRC